MWGASWGWKGLGLSTSVALTKYLMGSLFMHGEVVVKYQGRGRHGGSGSWIVGMGRLPCMLSLLLLASAPPPGVFRVFRLFVVDSRTVVTARKKYSFRAESLAHATSVDAVAL